MRYMVFDKKTGLYHVFEQYFWMGQIHPRTRLLIATKGLDNAIEILKDS